MTRQFKTHFKHFGNHAVTKMQPIRIFILGIFMFTGTSVTANASQLTVPNTYTAGTAISSSAMNNNFTAVQTAVNDNNTRLTAVEAANAARQSFYAEQGGTDVNASVDDTWVDVPGVAIPLTLAAPVNIRYQMFARIYNYGSAANTITSCSVRIVQDDAGTPLIPPASPATLGDWNGALVGGGGDVPGNAEQVALGGLVTALPAGTYNFKVQVARKTLATNSGNCSIFRWSYSRARLFLDIVP